MSKENEALQDKDRGITLSARELKELISSVVQTTKAGHEALANALLESRKPYKDPVAEETNRRLREQRVRQRKQLEENRKAEQSRCAHLHGSNSLSQFPASNGSTSIAKLVLDTGELIGVCTNCQRVWRLGDPDYNEWMVIKKTTNRTAEAGRRFFSDPKRSLIEGGAHIS